ncbi:MAG: redoxin domain-containing protein [Acidobacteria bacterium]|nr:redoxin domain-containing protein [Acidobacteriota bacterium]
MRKWVAGAVLASAMLMIAPGGASGWPDGELRVADLKALEAAIAGYKGQALLVNFWASWCEPCVDELPELIEVAREHRGKGVVVLTVSYDLVTSESPRHETLKEVGAFVTEQKMDLPVFLFDGPDDTLINERFGLPGAVPVTIAIDRGGKVVERHLGRATKERFGALIRRALRAR